MDDPYIVTTLTRLQIRPERKRASDLPDYSDVLDPESGIQLHAISLLELYTKWGIMYNVSVDTLDGDNHLEIIERFKAMVKALSDYTGHDRTLVAFSAPNENNRYHRIGFQGYYCRQTDSFNVTYR
jgi:hypothetical protein